MTLSSKWTLATVGIFCCFQCRCRPIDCCLLLTNCWICEKNNNLCLNLFSRSTTHHNQESRQNSSFQSSCHYSTTNCRIPTKLGTILSPERFGLSSLVGSNTQMLSSSFVRFVGTVLQHLVGISFVFCKKGWTYNSERLRVSRNWLVISNSNNYISFFLRTRWLHTLKS